MFVEMDEEIFVYWLFFVEEMVILMGENGFIYVCVFVGKVGEGVVKCVRLFECF